MVFMAFDERKRFVVRGHCCTLLTYRYRETFFAFFHVMVNESSHGVFLLQEQNYHSNSCLLLLVRYRGTPNLITQASKQKPNSVIFLESEGVEGKSPIVTVMKDRHDS